MAARTTKTFRASEEIIEALRFKANASKISESDIINNALICNLGLNNKSECLTYQSEIVQVQNQIKKLIQLNNLKYE